MKSNRTNKTIQRIIVVVLFLMGQQSAFAVINDTDTTEVKPVKCDTTEVKAAKADTTEVKKKKHECCEDTTITDHNDPYHKVVKEKGSVRYGLFTVRHIKDDWYLEVPDSLLGRMMLAVTRFTSTPQGFRKFSGEEVNRSAIYLEQYGPKAIFMREYVQSELANPDDRIAISLKQSTTDPIIVKFDVIGRNPKTKDQLINVTKWLMSDNKVTSFTASDRTSMGVTNVQADRTFIDSIKTFPINVEIQSLRTYGMNSSTRTPASTTGSVTLALNTSIVLLPEKPMQPRYFDERVGYFNDRITEFSDDQQVTNHEAIISRYRLEPKDLKALRAEVTKVLEGNRRLWWSGDEGRAQDPRSQTEDLGDNQMKANEYGLKNLKRVMQNIEKWTADEIRSRQQSVIASLLSPNAIMTLHNNQLQSAKAQQADGINGLHYKNLLLRIKKIREKYESGK